MEEGDKKGGERQGPREEWRGTWIKGRMERDKDQGKDREGRTRTKRTMERDKGQRKVREEQGLREGWRGRRVKGRILRDKGQGKDKGGQRPREE